LVETSMDETTQRNCFGMRLYSQLASYCLPIQQQMIYLYRNHCLI
jgi:hypothetical protein